MLLFSITAFFFCLDSRSNHINYYYYCPLSTKTENAHPKVFLSILLKAILFLVFMSYKTNKQRNKRNSSKEKKTKKASKTSPI